MAIRDNRIAAESIGINITKYKLIAFTISAMFAGMAGVLYGHNLSSLVAVKFDYNLSILVLVFVVLGGIGSMRGSIIAAVILTALPEAFAWFVQRLQNADLRDPADCDDAGEQQRNHENVYGTLQRLSAS